MLRQVTPLILTFNEAPNIGRVLAKLRWAERVVVVDSFSADDTEKICREFPNVDFIRHEFASFAEQCNFGLTKISTEWVLSLDADYILTDPLIAEMERMNPSPEVAGYAAEFDYCIAGRALRASLYPPRTVLYRRRRARYENDGHAHHVVVPGGVGRLTAKIQHDDRKPLAHWLWAQDCYAMLEVKKLLAAAPGALPLADRLRKMILPAPFLVFGYTLLVKGMILEGWPGWYYTLQRALAELILSLRLIEARLRSHE